jgi:WD40 repeat protein
LIRPHDPYGLGDLFILSRTSQNFDNPGTWNVKRFNRATKTYVETISPPTPQTVYDIAFHPDGALYVAGANGIFAYSESIAIPGFLNGGFSGRVGVMLPFSGNATGNLTFGPDGLLYVRNVATGDIDRYTALGQLVDTFIPFSAIADSYSPNVDIGRGSIQFGPDGDLYLMQSPGKIARFNGTTGEFVHATPSIYVNDRITVLPVPEPIAALMALVGCSFVGCVRRQGK